MFNEEIRHVPPLVLLAVNPRDGDAVPLHPSDNVRVVLQAIHHAPFEVALVFLEVPRAFLRIFVLAVNANRHIR